MIRVLHIIDHLDLGGAQTALLDMLSCRDRVAVHAEVAVMHGRGPFAGPLEEAGVPVHSLSPAKWPPAYVPSFLRLAHAGEFQVFHFHLPGANWIAKPLAALAGFPVRIAHDHTSGDLRFRGIGSLVPDAVSHLFSTRVIAVADGVGRFLRHWEAVPDDRIVVVANGVDDRAFRPARPGQRASARRAFGIPEDAFVVGGMGRLAYEKNFLMVPRLARRHERMEFLIAGAGPEEASIRREAATCGVDDRVRLPGSVENRAAFYHALDVFLLPSLHEGLPMTILEAMASGVPVLSSRLEGIVAALGADGLFAEPGNEEEFSLQLGRLAESETLRQNCASGALARVRASYSASGTARRVEDIYRAELAIAHAGATGKYRP